VRASSTEARELALAEVGERPGVQQRDLAAIVQERSGLAASTVLKLLQGLERDGELVGLRDGRRKAYALPGEATEEPVAPSAPAPGHATSGSGWELVALVSTIFIVAVLSAFFLVPEKQDRYRGSTEPAAAAPAPQPAAEPEPAPAPAPARKAKPRRRASGLAAARRARTAVLSGVGVPGIAGRTAKSLERKGFRVGTVANAPGPSERSLVLYRPGKRRAAHALARTMRIRSVRPVDAASRAVAPRAPLLVVLGADRD